MFTTTRCMFASNFPVDGFTAGTSLPELYSNLHSLVSDMSPREKDDLFQGTAIRVHKLDD